MLVQLTYAPRAATNWAFEFIIFWITMKEHVLARSQIPIFYRMKEDLATTQGICRPVPRYSEVLCSVFLCELSALRGRKMQLCSQKRTLWNPSDASLVAIGCHVDMVGILGLLTFADCFAKFAQYLAGRAVRGQREQWRLVMIGDIGHCREQKAVRLSSGHDKNTLSSLGHSVVCRIQNAPFGDVTESVKL